MHAWWNITNWTVVPLLKQSDKKLQLWGTWKNIFGLRGIKSVPQFELFSGVFYVNMQHFVMQKYGVSFFLSLPGLLGFILLGYVLNATFCVKSLQPTSPERITLCTPAKPGYHPEHRHKMLHWSDWSCGPFQARDRGLHICVDVSTTIAVDVTV